MAPEYGERVSPDTDSRCYRHPDRVSYTLCQRCGRTICGECQTPGPVGVLCPECVAEARRGYAQSQPVSLQAARLARRWAGQPVVTYSLIGICVVVFLVQLLGGAAVTNALLFAPVQAVPAFGLFEPWRMITAVFVHSPTPPYLHLLLNMLTLFIFGRVLEPALGRLQYAVLFVLAGFGGSAAVLLWGLVMPATLLSPVVGASGAIFGLMGAFAVILHSTGRGATQFYVLIAVNLVIGFLPGFNVSWQAHVGGLVVGLLFGLILVRTRARRQLRARWWLIGALAAVLVLVSVVVCVLLTAIFAR